jgi:hypothetical protein
MDGYLERSPIAPQWYQLTQKGVELLHNISLETQISSQDTVFDDIKESQHHFLPHNTILGELEIAEIYAYHDIPIFFLCKNTIGLYYVALFISSTDDSEQWLYVGTSFDDADLMKSGQITLYDFFKSPDRGDAFIFTRFILSDYPDFIVPICLNDLDDSFLPYKDVFLKG